MSILCRIFGHDRVLVERGARSEHECCARCEWVRRARSAVPPGSPIRRPALPQWRPHTLPPPVGTVAVIAMHDEHGAGAYLQPDLYVYQDDNWRDETTGHELRNAQFWWLPERELLAGLPQ